MQNRAALLREQHRARMTSSGGEVGDLLSEPEEPELPRLEDLPEFIEKMELEAQEMQAKAEQRRREMEEKYPQSQSYEHQPRGRKRCFACRKCCIVIKTR